MGHLARMQTSPFTLLKLDKRNDNLETTSEIVEMVPMINTQEFTASQFDPSPRAFFFSSDRGDHTKNLWSSKVESFAQLFFF